MTILRRFLPAAVLACLCSAWIPRLAAQGQPSPPPANPAPAAAAPQAQPAQQQQPANPFENVPQAPATPAPQPSPQPPAQAPAPAQPARPQLEAPRQPHVPAQPSGQYIEAIEFRGTRRVSQDTMKALLTTKPGDAYNEEALRRDFMQLWNTGRFDDIRIETEPGRSGVIVRFVVTERRVVRSIDYQGIHSVTVSEILDRYKERHVSLATEDQYDPNKVQRAVVVLKEFLSERGHQYATVEPTVEQVPPSSVKITFVVNEGPKVKVGDITVEGNHAFTSDWIVWRMKLLRPIGLPHSILFENLFAKTYDADKLEYDEDQIHQAYANNGYLKASIETQSVTIVRRGGSGWRLPLFHMNLPAIYADIALQVEEGRQYHIHSITFQGVKTFRAPDMLMPPLFKMGPGDVFSADKLKKGMDQMHKLYGELGFLDFVPDPDVQPAANSDQVDVTITVDEGKQFFVRRIDFSGNTTTRDKVIRRELLLDEGDILDMDLWDLSILRLNQLGYFEMLKKEDATDIRRNPNSSTVDLTLKVKERGKNTVGLNGGVSGITGSFVGFNYSTNNFLGLGETLSLNSQVGTRMQDVSLGFSEPYLFDRPISAGINVYIRRFNYNQGREASILSGQNLIPLYNSLGTQNLLNYTQDSRGITFSAGTHLRRSFAQIGVSYGFDRSSIVTQTTAALNYFQYLNFSGVSGPNSLNGIKTSHITPSYTYNTVNHPITPTGGHSAFFSVDFAGSILGGNVNTIRPAMEFKYFKAAPWHKGSPDGRDPNKAHVLAFRLTASSISGYGGKVAPPFARAFIGGEQDVRGFEIWGITPIAFIPSMASVAVYNDDGTPRTQRQIVNGVSSQTPVNMTVPSYQLITPGGDTQIVANFEYRIPIVGTTVQLTPFFDAGLNRILLGKQLTLEPAHVSDLNLQFPQASFPGQVKIAPGTQKIRASTGLEVEVMLPVIQAPFRVYFAYNPSTVREYLQPPIVADRASFPNYATFLNSVARFGQQYPFYEKRTMFRFTIGRTF
ncbi:MAG: outer membrane protein assembly factor BamA [Bryobacteraceae bacterium]